MNPTELAAKCQVIETHLDAALDELEGLSEDEIRALDPDLDAEKAQEEMEEIIEKVSDLSGMFYNFRCDLARRIDDDAVESLGRNVE